PSQCGPGLHRLPRLPVPGCRAVARPPPGGPGMPRAAPRWRDNRDAFARRLERPREWPVARGQPAFALQWPALTTRRRAQRRPPTAQPRAATANEKRTWMILWVDEPFSWR